MRNNIVSEFLQKVLQLSRKKNRKMLLQRTNKLRINRLIAGILCFILDKISFKNKILIGKLIENSPQ